MNVGVIAEFNPLHNGHVYLFNEINKKYKDSYKTLILDSEFSQRGELQVFDTFSRTKLSLDLGFDLVLLNPLLFSMQNAKDFAYSNIFFLNLAKVDVLFLGAESLTIDLLYEYSNLIKSNEFKEKMDSLMESGKSYKAAFLNSFKLLGYSNLKSNDILALFYYEAINKINPFIKIEIIQRKNSSYLNEYNNSNIQSASYIRSVSDFKNFVPDQTFKLYNEIGFRDEELLFPLILTSILNNNHLDQLNESCEGIENLLLKVYQYPSLKEFKKNILSKRYSESKINRLIVDSLFNINQKIDYTPYLRVLGFNEKGKQLLNKLKKNVKIYTKIKEGIHYEFDLEIKIAKILDSLYHTSLLNNMLKGPIIKK